MEVNFNEIVVNLSNEFNGFIQYNKQSFCKYIEHCEIINNKGKSSILNNKMFEFDEKINFNNYDFSERFLNLKVIISLLEIFNLTSLNTYKIKDFFDKNRFKYNIWKYLNNTEYINFDSLKYKKKYIIRMCISYSWEECLYELLKKSLDKSSSYKIFIWVDLFCVNQFNDKIKMKGLNNIDYAYSISDIYNISSIKAFNRYWCCYEMSIEKRAIDGILINKLQFDIKKKINQKLKEIFSEIFKDKLSYLNNKDKIKEFILIFQNSDEFNKHKFSLKNANISINKDKEYIDEKILKKYKTIEEYENRINVYMYLILYRDDITYFYLANNIMNL